MKITKFGQSCLLIETKAAKEREGGGEVRIILDPGAFSTAQNELTNVDLVLITHEHMDHLQIDSLKQILAHNPDVEILTNVSVQKILENEDIGSEVIVHGEVVTKKGVTIEGVGEKHAIMVNSIPPADNVGFMIANRFFYPGDALTLPGKSVEILALPTVAPWSKMSEIIDYAIAVHPNVAFPVHDSILAEPTMMQGMFVKVLGDAGVTFKPVELGTSYEF
jgi:L-ascorbate metabolism protein UlaG (beta-lactamase superfamily)